MRVPYYRRDEVEGFALRLLQQWRALRGAPIELPVDIDAVGEQVLGLSWLYEAIPEPPGTTIFAALDPEQRLIVLNERHGDTFGRFEGLERFTKAHELGHWVCHVRGERREPRGEKNGTFQGGTRLKLSALGSRLSPPEAERRWQEKHADWFAAALLMPALPLRREAASVDVTRWSGRYELRDRFGVSISALNARLRDLGYPPVR